MRFSSRSVRHNDFGVGRSAHTVSARRLIWSIAVCVSFVFLPMEKAWGVGGESTSSGNDLTVQVDARWAGCASGGYFPIRVRLVNRGPSRELTFRFSAQNMSMPMPTVERTVLADQNATLRFTLSIPMVAQMNFGTLDLLDRGRPLTAHRRQLQLPEMRGYYGSTDSDPSLLVISETPVDFARFDEGVQFRSSTIPGRYTYSRASNLCETVGPTMLPEAWIDYSGLDLVAVPMTTFAEMPKAARDALIGWVHCGGTLMVSDVGADIAKRDELSRLLGFETQRFAESEWKPTVLQRSRIAMPQTDQFGNPIHPGTHRPRGGTTPNQENTEAESDITEEFAWPGTPEDFVSRELMLGKVYAFQGNPFPGSVHDWAWFLNTVGDDRLLWEKRHGMSARDDHEEFLEFLNPGVRGVPTYTFLVLITLFTVVIGPVNYILLRKRRQLYLLLITVPLIAFLTSTSLLAYSIVSHGFGVKSRIRSLTFLDQSARTSVTMARLALHAGLAPSGGLRFSSETAVYPVWPKDQGFESGTVDWTETQGLQSGWLLSRTHTQFLTMSHAAARGRLDVDAVADDRMPVANGHENDIEMLIVMDDSGKPYVGTDLPAGASAILRPALREDYEQMNNLLDRNAPALPEGIERSERLSLFGAFGPPRSRPRWNTSTETVRFDSNMMERRIHQLHNMNLFATDAFPPKSYVAILRSNPGIETGLPKTEEEAGYHLLVGYY